MVKEQVMKLMAIIKQEMQLLCGWQAGKSVVTSVLEPNGSFGQSFILTWFLSHEAIGNVATSHDPSPPPPTPPQHFIRFPWQLTGTHSYSWVDGGYVRENYVPPPRTQHNGLTRCWVYRPLNQESNPPSDRSLYLLVGLLDSTFFPNSNSGLIKMLLPDKRASPSRRSRSE